MDRKTTNRVISFLVDQQKVRNPPACFNQTGGGSAANVEAGATALLSAVETLSGMHTRWRRVCLRLNGSPMKDALEQPIPVMLCGAWGKAGGLLSTMCAAVSLCVSAGCWVVCRLFVAQLK